LTTCGGAAPPMITPSLNAVSGCIDLTMSCANGSIATEYYNSSPTLLLGPSSADLLTCTNGNFVSASNGGNQVSGFGCVTATPVQTCVGGCPTGYSFSSTTGFCYMVCFNEFFNQQNMNHKNDFSQFLRQMYQPSQCNRTPRLTVLIMADIWHRFIRLLKIYLLPVSNI
jgi:hypothetical protein